MLSCSALKAVRSRRPPLPPASSAPEPSGCPAPHGRSPAPGDGGERGRGQPGPGTAGVPARAPLRPGQPPHRRSSAGPRGAAAGPSVPPPPSAGRPRRPPRPRLPAAGAAAKRSLLLPLRPAPPGRSALRSLKAGLELEPGRRPAEDARCGEPSEGLVRAWLLWDSHSTEKGALVILPCFGDAGKVGVGEHSSSFIPQDPEENVVCVNTHQRDR